METEGKDRKYFCFLAGVLLLVLMIGHSVPEPPSGRFAQRRKKDYFANKTYFSKFCFSVRLMIYEKALQSPFFFVFVFAFFVHLVCP